MSLRDEWRFWLEEAKRRNATLLFMVLCVGAAPLFMYAQEVGSVPSLETNQTANGSLSVAEVVAKLVAGNAARAKALESYTGRRSYRLDYHGFPSSIHAEMIVTVAYRAPATKKFTVVSESGSKLIINRVFHKLLESEEEALNPRNLKETALNERNYDFTLLRFEPAPERSCYVLAVHPKLSNKFLYRGTIWVDATDFAVWRIDAEPAKNPSFWTKQSQILHTYIKLGEFWMPANNHTTTLVRLGGKSVLNIDYEDYKINEARVGTTEDRHAGEKLR